MLYTFGFVDVAVFSLNGSYGASCVFRSDSSKYSSWVAPGAKFAIYKYDWLVCQIILCILRVLHVPFLFEIRFSFPSWWLVVFSLQASSLDDNIGQA